MTNLPPEIPTDFIFVPSWVLLTIAFAIGLIIGAVGMFLFYKRK
jgi:hypothetical protein